MKRTLLLMSAVAMIAAGCAKDGFAEGMYSEPIDGMTGMPFPEDGDSEGGNFDTIVDNPFVETASEAVSTFSVDADGAAYSYLKTCVYNGWRPNRGAVRIEEYINYFPFNYADPQGDENVALNAEIGTCPWNTGHMVMRLGLKGKTLTDTPQANFVFLIDVSGSMSGETRLDLLKEGLVLLVDQLDPNDRVSIITYSGSVKKLLESTAAKDAARIKKAINSLSAGGSTAGGAAMKMAYEEAMKNFIKGGNNRVIMGTDGDFNVGVSSTDALMEMAQDYAGKGIYLTVCGVGTGNLNDSMMEKVSNWGNGTYEYLGSSDDLLKVFVRERGKFTSVANDCKVQVSFNPETVLKYRLIGYENRVLSNQDFENDSVDAAEVGAGQTITALYELVPAEGFGNGNAARFDFRYKKSLGADSRLLSLDIKAAAADKVSEDFSFACSLASFGMVLRESEYRGESSYELARSLAEKGSVSFDPYDYRKNFISLIDQTSKLR